MRKVAMSLFDKFTKKSKSNKGNYKAPSQYEIERSKYAIEANKSFPIVSIENYCVIFDQVFMVMNKQDAVALPEDVATAFTEAAGTTGLVPVAYVAEQIVSGTNYMFLVELFKSQRYKKM